MWVVCISDQLDNMRNVCVCVEKYFCRLIYICITKYICEFFCGHLFILRLFQPQRYEPEQERIPVSVVGEFHLICFQFGEQQHQDLDKYEENYLQHIQNTFLRSSIMQNSLYP